MATNTTEEIIEKRDTSPLATSCLAVALLAIIGAITFQVMELAEIRADWAVTERDQGKILRAKREVADLESRVSGPEGVLANTRIIEPERKKTRDTLDGVPGADGTKADATLGTSTRRSSAPSAPPEAAAPLDDDDSSPGDDDDSSPGDDDDSSPGDDDDSSPLDDDDSSPGDDDADASSGI